MSEIFDKTHKRKPFIGAKYCTYEAEIQNQRNLCFWISRFGMSGCVERQCCTSFCPLRHHNLVDLVDVDLLFNSPEAQSQAKLICPKKREHDRTEATGQAWAESIAEMPSPFPFETLSSVFALLYSVLLSTSADCRKTHPATRARESGVFYVVLAVFSFVLTVLHLMRPPPDSLEAIDQWDPFVSRGHFRQCPFLSHYFDRNWISSDAFLCILSAAVFSLGVYHF